MAENPLEIVGKRVDSPTTPGREGSPPRTGSSGGRRSAGRTRRTPTSQQRQPSASPPNSSQQQRRLVTRTPSAGSGGRRTPRDTTPTSPTRRGQGGIQSPAAPASQPPSSTTSTTTSVNIEGVTRHAFWPADDSLTLSVFALLDESELCAVAVTCRYLNAIAQDSRLMRPVCPHAWVSEKELQRELRAWRDQPINLDLSIGKVHYNRLSPEALATALSPVAHNVYTLDLGNRNRAVDDVVLDVLSERCAALSSLKLPMTGWEMGRLSTLMRAVGPSLINLELASVRVALTARHNSVICAVAETATALRRLVLHQWDQSSRVVPHEDLLLFAESMPALTSLSLSHTATLDDGIVELLTAAHPLFRELRLLECPNISDRALSGVAANCHVLNCLDVSGSQNLSHEGVVAVATNNPYLYELGIANCPLVDGDGLCEIARTAPNLHTLSLGVESNEKIQSNIQQSALESVAWPRLKHLRVHQGSSVSGPSLVWIGGSSTALRTLRITDNLSHNAVAHVAPKLHLVTSLELHWCWELYDEDVACLSAHLPSVTRLSFAHCKQITDGGLASLAATATALTSLDVRDCDEVSGEFLLTLAPKLKCLRSLDVSNARPPKKNRDKQLTALAQHCSELRVLGLNYAEIGGEGVEALCVLAPRLVRLIVGVTPFSDDDVAAIAPHATELRELVLRNTKITDKALNTLGEYFPALRAVHVGSTDVTTAAVEAFAFARQEVSLSGTDASGWV